MGDALQESLLMRALRQETTPRRPIWLMRQAGRYLPEYRATRKAAGSFLAMVHTPSAASEVTLQPIARFGFDASIIFSDILIVPEAMQLGLHFVEGEGPRLSAPIASEAAVAALPVPPPEAYGYLYDAIGITRRHLPPDVPLIGFAGAPFTLACYMVDGGGGAFWRTRAMLRQRPEVFSALLEKTAQAVARLLVGQLDAGCQVAMLFDSWGGLLEDTQYEAFSLRHIRAIIQEVRAAHPQAPVIVFGRQCGMSLPAIAECGCAAAGVDWQTGMDTAKRLTGGKVALQGNMDPAVLLTDAETVQREAKRILAAYGDAPGHIFNLGHGIDKSTPVENVAALVEAVRGWR